jgi:NADH:ubiquinone oxidoreductase subunit 3 (subunit A)
MFTLYLARLYIALIMPDNYFARYLPLLIHLIVVGVVAGAIVTLSWIIGYRRPTRAKLSPYE